MPLFDDELVDSVDMDCIVTGQLSRSSAHRDGVLHRTFHCWCAHPENGGSIIFQLRGENVGFPLRLDVTAGGHFRSGESAAEAYREIEEELGIRVEFSDLRFIGRRLFEFRGEGVHLREMMDAFVMLTSEWPGGFRPNPLEIRSLVSMPVKDALSVLKGATDRSSIHVLDSGSNSPTVREAYFTDDSFVPGTRGYFIEAAEVVRELLSGNEAARLS